MRFVARLIATLVFAAAVLTAPALTTPAHAAGEPPPEILGGVTVTGATITTPGKPTRKLDADQATAFMQKWFPDSVFSKVPNVPRPKSLVISKLAVVTNWNGIREPMTVLYAVSGKSAYVGMPPQGFGWGSVTSEKWIIAPQSAQLMQAFAGKLQPDRSGEATTTTIGPPTKTSSSSSSTPWFVLGGIVVVILGGGAAFVIRRRQNL